MQKLQIQIRTNVIINIFHWQLGNSVFVFQTFTIEFKPN